MSLLTAQSECSMTWTKHNVLCSYTSYCTVALEIKKIKNFLELVGSYLHDFIIAGVYHHLKTRARARARIG